MLNLRRRTRVILASTIAVASLASMGCSAAGFTALKQPAPTSVAVNEAAQAKRLPFQMSASQIEAVQKAVRPDAQVVDALDEIGHAVNGDLSKLSPEQAKRVRSLLQAQNPSPRFWGLAGNGQFAGEGSMTKLGGNRFLYRVPKNKVLVIQTVENPHMMSIDGFNLVSAPDSFNLTVNTSSQSNCNNYGYWWWWGNSCGSYGYWGWWYWYYYGWGRTNNNSNSSSATAQQSENIHRVNYLLGDNNPVVFGSVALTGWRATGYTIPDTFIGAMSAAK